MDFSNEVKLRVKRIDLDSDRYVVVLHEETARSMGEGPDGRVDINGELTALINLSRKMVGKDEIGLFVDVMEALGVREGDIVEVKAGVPPRSAEYIKRKIDGEVLGEKEYWELIEDIVRRRLYPAEVAAFIVASHIRGLTMEEVYYLTRFIAESGETVSLEGEVVDKHSIGGVPGNRVTLFIVPFLATLGFKVPKLSSRAITSPAGTADTMEVLAPVTLSASRIKEVVEETGGCIAWGGSARIAYADDVMINIRRPLSLDPPGIVLASIMAKKVAVSSKTVIIDYPVGPEAKVKNHEEVKQWSEKFKKLGEMLGIKVLTYESIGIQPIGRGIGPVLEAKDVLLHYENGITDYLLEKAADMAGRIVTVHRGVNISRARKMVMDTFRDGRAEKKLREIIREQGGDPEVKAEDLEPSSIEDAVYAEKDGRVDYISIRYIARAARIAGAPQDKGAGIWMNVRIGSEVKKGDVLLRVFASSRRKLEEALHVAEKAIKLR